jgi:predicted metalloprotease with PDZ domain
MLGDLLPQFTEYKQSISAKLKFEVPPEWKIISSEKISSEKISSDNIFLVKNIEKAIFAVGKKWRGQETLNSNLTISGEWQFTDAEAAKMAGEIFDEYRKLFGEIPAEKVQIFLHRFPKETKFGRWEAETRGANLTILSSDVPFKTLSLQRLHEQLRHELFHLWIPNNLALTGNYDWFYEGFTVYQALRTGIATNQIRFEDVLDTLTQAYNLDNFQSQKVSLIESSKNRWSGASGQVYARGMLVAFLCDLAILKQSRGKRSINDIFREIYQKHRVPNESADGNAAILKILNNYSELNLIIESYVKGSENINWKTDLESVGIETKEENSFIKLNVKTKLSGKQKDLLDKLGYNNWRKISEKLK